MKNKILKILEDCMRKGYDDLHFESDRNYIANAIIESGNLIELPCKVGDTIFFEGFRNGSESIGILEHKVIGFILKVLTKGKDDIVPTDIPIKDFGKDVFFTKEELKNYLKELSK